MQLHKDKMLLRLIGLIAIAATGCQSTDPFPGERAQNPLMPARTACQKADSMWNDKIVPSRYDQLPPLTSPGILDLLKLITGSFSVKALTAKGDELEEGRHKLIHAFGAEARLRLVISPGAAGGYTGIFRSGAECVIGRFSLANKPAKDTSIPALALKIFIDGDQPSVNLQLMYSIDGQAGHNFFAHTFSNILPPAIAFPKRVLTSGFEQSAVQFGAKDPNPGRLTLEHLAGTLPDGSRVPAPRAPYQLLFKPTAQARALMQEAGAEDDFRLKLAGLPVGQAVYDIYTLAEGEPAENARLLGQLILAAPLVSSHYGDEKLFFRHNMERK
jgi:hypothetical protein